jgi:hypothetical protein
MEFRHRTSSGFEHTSRLLTEGNARRHLKKSPHLGCRRPFKKAGRCEGDVVTVDVAFGHYEDRAATHGYTATRVASSAVWRRMQHG